ncbi:MAG TPA: PspC domain-containing protein [Solirubrobacteraceae bacterium]|jgi:phage shock protein PspC (stress-responsive transcriptional regulator)
MQQNRLHRSRTDRIIGGVCGGIAREYRLDPTLVRIGFVVGVLLWGAGALVYLAALFLMPEAEPGTEDAAAPLPPLGDRNRVLAVIGVVVLVAVGGPLLLALALVAAIGLGFAWLVTGRRPASVDAGEILRLTLLGLGVLALLVVLAFGSFWGSAAGGDLVVAACVAAAGLALVASAFTRPARWLILPALVLAIPAGFVAAAGIDLDGGIGDKTYRPTAVADIREHYEVGAGSLTIDLRDVELPQGSRRVHVDVGMGEAVVLVPDDVCVSTTAELGMGGVGVFDRDTGGIDVDWEDLRTPPPGTPRLVVDADIGVGALEVGRQEIGHGRGWHDGSRGANEACVA